MAKGQNTRVADLLGIEHPTSRLGIDTMAHEVAVFVDGKIREYSETPKLPGGKGKAAVMRSKDEVMAFSDIMFGGDGKKYLHSLEELYGPGDLPHAAKHRDTPRSRE